MTLFADLSYQVDAPDVPHVRSVKEDVLGTTHRNPVTTTAGS